MIEIYEKKVLPKIGRVLLLSEVDMRDMQEQHAYDNIGCVSYGINLPPMKEIVGFDKRTEGKIVFSGSMFHPPNIDGALFFLKHIYPLILHDYPTAKLWIVGAEPDSRIHDAAAFFGEHVIITGRVNEVSEYLQFARVSVCPIRLKIGVQTKILEALSWGTPVVTTTAGNSGIGGCSGRDLLIEDEPNKFARCVVNLLRGESWNQLSEEGRKLVEKQFSWAGSIEQLNKYIKLLILKN